MGLPRRPRASARMRERLDPRTIVPAEPTERHQEAEEAKGKGSTGRDSGFGPAGERRGLKFAYSIRQQ